MVYIYAFLFIGIFKFDISVISGKKTSKRGSPSRFPTKVTNSSETSTNAAHTKTQKHRTQRNVMCKGKLISKKKCKDFILLGIALLACGDVINTSL